MTKRRIIIIETDDDSPISLPKPDAGLYAHPEYDDPCAGCSNNPMVNPNASGVCCCALPAMRNTRYTNGGNIPFGQFTTTTFTGSFGNGYNVSTTVR